jgi:hypothetical protein
MEPTKLIPLPQRFKASQKLILKRRAKLKERKQIKRKKKKRKQMTITKLRMTLIQTKIQEELNWRIY